MINKLVKTSPSRSLILIRLIVGVVFLSEGIQKFLFSEQLGTGRFARIGFPQPAFFSSLAGTFEIICGALVLIGLLTRLASIPLIIVISVAIITTKIPILLHSGIWSALHESRTDMSMFLGSFYLLINGGGKWSWDYQILKETKKTG